MRNWFLYFLLSMGLIGVVAAQSFPTISAVASPIAVATPCVSSTALGCLPTPSPSVCASVSCGTPSPTPIMTPSPSPSPSPSPKAVFRYAPSINPCWLISIFPSLASDNRSPFYGMDCSSTSFQPQCAGTAERALVSGLPLCHLYTPTPAPLYSVLPKAG